MDIAMKESRNEGGNRMENEIYPIMTEDGKMFCKCRNDGTTVETDWKKLLDVYTGTCIKGFKSENGTAAPV